jgi:L-ascorbate metabolism protein UlaG (beta-lactamase superfamily)
LMEKCEVKEHQIEELEWWQSTQVVEDKGRPPLSITCAPTQHWSCRTMWDRNQRLWCSFVVDSQDKRFFFGGDTGFPEPFPLFSQIGQRLGPFDLAALPIGAYRPRYFMADSHCNPSEAVQIHQQIRATKSIAIHWATFRLAEESDDEPPLLLKAAAEEANADFSTLKLGESIEVNGSRKQNYS